MAFRFIKQLNGMDCGPTCLQMILAYYGRKVSSREIRTASDYSKSGVSLFSLSEVATKFGLDSRGVALSAAQLKSEVHEPCILHWGGNHFVVYLPSRTSFFGKYFRAGHTADRFKIADPRLGIVTISEKELLTSWSMRGAKEDANSGVALLLEPSFSTIADHDKTSSNNPWITLLKSVKVGRRQIIQVILTFLIASVAQIIFPYLTQGIVDQGVNAKDLGFIKIVLIGQAVLIISRTLVDFIRTRIITRVTMLLSYNILSEFWEKILKLPLWYFNTYHTGDITQRLADNKVLQQFIVNTAIVTIFNIISFLLFAFILASYSLSIFSIFLLVSIVYLIWIFFFQTIRRNLNFKSFRVSAKEQQLVFQMVSGMQDLRLNNAEKFRKWEWQNLQMGLYDLEFKTLNYNQLQRTGALLINQGKDIVITLIVAGMVIDNKITLGAMMAIQYILSQLSGPIEQFVSTAQQFQDAKISMERLKEIHDIDDEESVDEQFVTCLPKSHTISIRNLYFTYPGAHGEWALEDLSMTIPEGKTTAIVGASGSGKTTLLKLLLKIYDVPRKSVFIGDKDFYSISHRAFRANVGAVLQDGMIFNDTIANNIAMGSEVLDEERFQAACEMANVDQFVKNLPKGYGTMLGQAGAGLSQGQKQRVLLARAIYKQPAYLFLDEATNALDANTESTIVSNLNSVFVGKTVVIVAHRLSTVQYADNIIVLESGRVVEQGSHRALLEMEGYYWQLVKKQTQYS